MAGAGVYMSVGEAHRRLSEYVNEFTEAIASQNGPALKTLLSISSNSPYRESIAAALSIFKDASRLVKQVEKYAQLGDMLQQHMHCMQSFQYKHYVDAYYALEKSANAFLQEFRNWETAWAMDAVYTIAYEMRTLAEMADKEMAVNGKNPDKLKGAGSFLMKVFAALAGKGPKRVGALYVTCQLFKVYFKLGTVHLCRSVIRSIETARGFDFEEFPTRDKVTYMYYTGRLEVFNDNFIMYIDVVQALRRGDLRLLRHALQDHEDQFLRSGVYLVLEKLELQAYKRLIKKIYIFQKQKDPNKAHQVKMDIIVKALKWLEIDMDVEEVECIMANLIHRSLIRGYFSHKSKVVVLSKQDPFPKLIGRPVNS